ncbi:MAG: SDR family oxidoreductase [Burkholderiales bacterium]|nr:SDR family oxidoreductase [Burkholderiales bacterium]
MSTARYRCVLTGASGGLGAAFAHALAPQSSAMILAGRDRDRLDALERALRGHHPALALAVVAGDICQAAVQQHLVGAARDLGTIDLLINAAGINEFHGFESQSAAAIERLLAVDLLAPIQLTQRLLPLLKAAPRAQVINVGSIFGYLGYPGFAVYCAAKFGLRGFSQALRRELSDSHVSVRYFAPRATRTALTTPAIAAMNRDLATREDAPEHVARMLVRFVGAKSWERKLGFPERFYVLLNHLLPMINDQAIRAQLKTIRKHLQAGPDVR